MHFFIFIMKNLRIFRAIVINNNRKSIYIHTIIFIYTSTVHTLGTEERITDVSKKIAASDEVMPFVSFPGYEIKDLYVHEPGGGAAAAAETLSTPPEVANYFIISSWFIYI